MAAGRYGPCVSFSAERHAKMHRRIKERTAREGRMYPNPFLLPAEPFRFRTQLRCRRARGSIGLVIVNAAFHFHACGELPHAAPSRPRREVLLAALSSQPFRRNSCHQSRNESDIDEFKLPRMVRVCAHGNSGSATFGNFQQTQI